MDNEAYKVAMCAVTKEFEQIAKKMGNDMLDPEMMKSHFAEFELARKQVIRLTNDYMGFCN